MLIALLVAASTVTMAAAAGAATTSTEVASSTTAQSDAEADADASAHVTFDLQGDAITNYRVDGEETFSSVAVQSQSEAESGTDFDADVGLEAATNLDGASLSVATRTQASTEIRTESGATLSAHDTERGTLVVESGDEAQYVEAELGADAEARQDGDRVRVETDGREGTFLVVGDGEVGVTDGTVTADLGENATLAFRSSEDGERDERVRYEESLIAEGNAAVEATATTRDGELVTDTVSYGQETAANASQTAANRVNVTVDRAVHEGTIVMTTVSEEAVGSLETVSVAVDGEAAVEVSSKSELEGAIGSDESRYMVVQDDQAEGQATVYIAVNHFSERTAAIEGEPEENDGETENDDSESDSDGDDGTGSGDSKSGNDDTESGTDDNSDDSGEDTTSDTDDSAPGFGVGVAVVAISVAGLLSRLRQ